MDFILQSAYDALLSTHESKVELMYELCKLHKKRLEDEEKTENVLAGTWGYLYGSDGWFIGYKRLKRSISCVSLPYLDHTKIDVEELVSDSYVGVKIQKGDEDPILYLASWDTEDERCSMYDISIYTIYLEQREGTWYPHREKREGCSLCITYKGSFLLKDEFSCSPEEYLKDVIENTKKIQSFQEPYHVHSPLITEIISLENI